MCYEEGLFEKMVSAHFLTIQHKDSILIYLRFVYRISNMLTKSNYFLVLCQPTTKSQHEIIVLKPFESKKLLKFLMSGICLFCFICIFHIYMYK